MNLSEGKKINLDTDDAGFAMVAGKYIDAEEVEALADGTFEEHIKAGIVRRAKAGKETHVFATYCEEIAELLKIRLSFSPLEYSNQMTKRYSKGKRTYKSPFTLQN